jgi:FtsZ-interacting cell division protein YlmF
MKIINPLYDKAFKYLMDNEPLAKKILSVIIDQDIISLESRPQETPVLVKETKTSVLRVLRFDFTAIISTKEDERYATIIEVQKSRSPNPTPRFRRYLGKNYLNEHSYIDENGQTQREHLPIISVYFLGYNLGTGEYDTPGILVNNSVIDAITKKPINIKHKFVKLLTHPCYILQVERLKEDRKTRLEKMLSLFDQSHCTEDKYFLDVEEIDEEFNEVADYLSRPTLDSAFVRSLVYEEDYEKDLKEERQQKEAAQKREDEERRQKEEAQKREEEANKSLKKIIITMLDSGKALSEIANMLDKTEKEVSKIIEV